MSMYSRGKGWHKQAKAAARRQAGHLGRYSQKRRRSKPKSLEFVLYHEYMGSPEWSAKKAEFFSHPMTPKACIACGCDECDLHHVTYDRLGNELLSDLVPLCRPCHKKTHAKDPLAGKNGLRGFRKSLVYDFGIGTDEVNRRMHPYMLLEKFKLRKQRQCRQPRNKRAASIQFDGKSSSRDQTASERENSPANAPLPDPCLNNPVTAG